MTAISLIEDAIAVAETGFGVFPCGPDKAPVCVGGFKAATKEPGRIRSLFSHSAAAMIGLPTGEASGIIAVDVDIRHDGNLWHDAHRADLPATRIHRTLQGGLHILFKDGGHGIRNSAGRIAPGVDIRGTGGYIIMPPSPGYSVLDASPVADMPAWLVELCRKPPEAATSPAQDAPARTWQPASRDTDASPYGRAALDGACDDLRHTPDGSKHHAINKAGWSVGGLVGAGEVFESDAWRELNGALADLLPRCENKRAAQHTLARSFSEGKSRPRDVPERPADQGPDLSNIAPLIALLAPFNEVLQRAATSKPLPVSSDILAVDGVLKMLVDECTRTAIRPQPFLALGAAICAVGVLAGRKYRTATDLRTNIYIAAIAESGGGKDHAVEVVRRCMDDAGLERYLGGETIASGRAVLSSLERHPARLFQIDELGLFLASVTGKKAAPYKAEIWSELMKLYSRAKGIYRGTEYANKRENPRIDINQPCVGFYATSTPSTFWAALEGGALLDGSLARFLLFITDNNRPERNLEPGIFKPSDGLLSALRAITFGVDGVPAPGNLPAPHAAEMLATDAAEPATVHMTSEAKALHAMKLDGEDDWARKVEGTPQSSIVNRLGENAIKLALISAVSRCPSGPSIIERDVKWGWALAEHSARSLIREADENIAETPFQRNVQACLKSVRKHGPVTQAEMFRKGWTIPRKDQAEILDALTNAGKIIATQQDAGKAGGRPTVRYTIAAI